MTSNACKLASSLIASTVHLGNKSIVKLAHKLSELVPVRHNFHTGATPWREIVNKPHLQALELNKNNNIQVI